MTDVSIMPTSQMSWMQFARDLLDYPVAPFVDPDLRILPSAKLSGNHYEVGLSDGKVGFLSATQRNRRQAVRTSDALDRYETFFTRDIARLRSILQTVQNDLLWSDPTDVLNDQFITWQKKACEKFTLQAVNWPWWDIEDYAYGLEASADDPNPMWVEACYFLARYFKTHLRAGEPHGIIRHKNHGYPTWGKDDVDLCYHAILAQRLGQSVDFKTASIGDISHQLNRRFHSEGESAVGGLPPCLTVFSRMGPRIKPISLTTIDARSGFGLVLGESTGLVARARMVYAAPSYINILLYKLGYPYAMGAIQTIGMWHDKSWTTEAHIKRIEDEGFGNMIADDMAAYDHHISFAKMEAWSRALDEILGLSHPLSIFTRISTAVETLPICVCGASVGQGEALLRRKGMLTSGQRGTTYWGCMVNILRQLCLHHRLTGRMTAGIFDARYLREGPLWRTIIWGDDTILFTRSAGEVPQEERWKELNAEMGLEVTYDDGPIFLQKWRGRYANVGRMMQQTFGPEKKPSGPYGLQNSLNERFKLMEGHQKRGELYELIRDECDFPLPRDPSALKQFVDSPGFAEGFAHELKAKGGLSSIDEIAYLLETDSPKLESLLSMLRISIDEFEREVTISLDELTRRADQDRSLILAKIGERHGRNDEGVRWKYLEEE